MHESDRDTQRTSSVSTWRTSTLRGWRSSVNLSFTSNHEVLVSHRLWEAELFKFKSCNYSVVKQVRRKRDSETSWCLFIFISICNTNCTVKSTRNIYICNFVIILSNFEKKTDWRQTSDTPPGSQSPEPRLPRSSVGGTWNTSAWSSLSTPTLSNLAGLCDSFLLFFSESSILLVVAVVAVVLAPLIFYWSCPQVSCGGLFEVLCTSHRIEVNSHHKLLLLLLHCCCFSLLLFDPVMYVHGSI